MYGDRNVTFRQHHERANRLASALHGLGLRAQDRISILSQNTLEFMECFGACELSGLIAATVNFRLAPPEMLYILTDSTPRALIFEAQYADTIEQIRDRLPHIETYICFGGAVPEWARDYETLIASGDVAGAPMRPRPDDIMHLIYTSGTTGQPEGVRCAAAPRADLAMAAGLVSLRLGSDCVGQAPIAACRSLSCRRRFLLGACSPGQDRPRAASPGFRAGVPRFCEMIPR